MAPDALAFTLAQFVVFLVAIVVRQRAFAAKRLTAAELLEQARLVRLIIARGLRGTRATKEDVKELTQDVLLAAWEASEGDRYRPDPDEQPARALQGWLRGLAFHHVSHHREAARMRCEELVADPPDVERGPDVEQAIEREQTRIAMLEVLRQLPEQECTAVLGHDIDEIPMEDVASELGAPVSTVYKWRARGIAALARALRPARR
jgi:RNA polymerase sigma-70 factor (ECF subfamily)